MDHSAGLSWEEIPVVNVDRSEELLGSAPAYVMWFRRLCSATLKGRIASDEVGVAHSAGSSWEETPRVSIGGSPKQRRFLSPSPLSNASIDNGRFPPATDQAEFDIESVVYNYYQR